MSFDISLINNDLSVQPNGAVKIVTDTPKLRQDIIKIIITPMGSVKNHPWYGCSISDDIGRNFSDLLQLSRIQNNISKSLDRLKALQISQSSVQRVSLSELIESVGGIDVERDLSDGRQLNILITVFSKRLTKLEELFTIIS
ncbi:MAG: hypothetical protein WC523_00530 [Patescibacteria group bacterium]